MGFTLSQISAYVRTYMIKDPDAILGDAAVQAMIAQVVAAWRPLKRHTVDISGDGSTYRYTCASVFTSWIQNVSQITRIVYPTGYQAENILALDTFRIQKNSSDADEVVFIESTFTSGYTARITYSGKHAVTDVEAACTFNDDDFLPLCRKLAYECSMFLASHYAQAAESGIDADNVDYRSRAREQLAIAKELKATFNQEIKQRGKHAAFGDWDRKLYGRDFFFHGKDDR